MRAGQYHYTSKRGKPLRHRAQRPLFFDIREREYAAYKPVCNLCKGCKDAANKRENFGKNDESG